MKCLYYLGDSIFVHPKIFIANKSAKCSQRIFIERSTKMDGFDFRSYKINRKSWRNGKDITKGTYHFMPHPQNYFLIRIRHSPNHSLILTTLITNQMRTRPDLTWTLSPVFLMVDILVDTFNVGWGFCDGQLVRHFVIINLASIFFGNF